MTHGYESRKADLAPVHTIDFHADRLEIVEVAGQPWWVLRPVCEALGLDFSSQLRRLRESDWANCGHVTTVADDGKTREMVAVDRRTYTMWLGSIQTNRVAPATRAKLRAYQLESSAALDAYWHEGAAINPRATTEQIAAALHEHQLRCLAMARAAKLVDSGWLEAKARHVLARALGGEPEVDPARRPLTVGEYLEEQGVRGAQLRRLARDFGKWLKAEYRAEYGRNPQMVPRFVDGAQRAVCGYTEAHRPLFDAVWTERCAHGDSNGLLFESPIAPLPKPKCGRRGRPA